MAWLRVGKVVRPLGLEGLVGVAGSEGGLGRLGLVALERGGRRVESRVLWARPQGRLWAVRLEVIGDRRAAEGWVGAEVLARRADLGEAGAGFHFWGDLEGLPVVTASGEPVGKVIGLWPTGGVDVVAVKGEAGEVLIPLAPYVRVEEDRVVVDPPEGLLEASKEEEGAKDIRRRRPWPRSRSRS